MLELPKELVSMPVVTKIEEELSGQVSGFVKGGQRVPRIVSLCNKDDHNSVLYTDMKRKKASKVGIDFIPEYYNSDAQVSFLEELIERFNSDEKVDAVMVQLPLPDHMKRITQDVLERIVPEKDVDGLTLEGRKIFMPATTLGVKSMVEYYQIDVAYSNVVVVGSKGQVGSSIMEMLEGLESKPIGVDIGDDRGALLNADVVFCAVNAKGVVDGNEIKEGAVLFDVGLGNFTPSALEKAHAYTPEKGGVGPVTVVSLLQNVVKAYGMRLGQSSTDDRQQV